MVRDRRDHPTFRPRRSRTGCSAATSSSRATRREPSSCGKKLEGGSLGEILPTRERYGFIWTTLGTPERELFDIPEADEPDRRHVVCGAVAVRASGLRIVENFLDMAHFPFVHTDILGAEPHTEVRHYTTEIRRDVDEVWATNCEFFQPQAALSATGGTMTQYMYRVAAPFQTLALQDLPRGGEPLGRDLPVRAAARP